MAGGYGNSALPAAGLGEAKNIAPGSPPVPALLLRYWWLVNALCVASASYVDRIHIRGTSHTQGTH
jgi:hypothetical protein